MAGSSSTVTLPKWEEAARTRIKTHLRAYAKTMRELVARDANESDTRMAITDMLDTVLGFDKFSDLSTEYRVRGEYADYGIRLDQQLIAFVEVKRCTTKLNEKHLRQVEMYAVNEGVEWLILTNGVEWQVYRLIAGLPVTLDLVMTVDLLDEQTPSAKKVDALFYLTKESLKRGQIEEVWHARAATAPKSLATMILSAGPITEIRRELKRQTGHSIDDAELARLIQDTVIRAELSQ